MALYRDKLIIALWLLAFPLTFNLILSVALFLVLRPMPAFLLFRVYGSSFMAFLASLILSFNQPLFLQFNFLKKLMLLLDCLPVALDLLCSRKRPGDHHDSMAHISRLGSILWTFFSFDDGSVISITFHWDWLWTLHHCSIPPLQYLGRWPLREIFLILFRGNSWLWAQERSARNLRR